jgi:hypothetical protein
MKVSVIGSRTFECYEMMKNVLANLKPTQIISGGAGGADRLAAKYAAEHGLKLIEIKPNWKIGRHAGLLRNTEIVDSCVYLLAFWDGKSKGTKDSINKATKKSVPYQIVNF